MPEVDSFFDPIKKKWVIEVSIDDHGEEFISEISIDKCGEKKHFEFERGFPLEYLGDLIIGA